MTATADPASTVQVVLASQTAAVLFGSLLTGAFALITLVISNRHARRLAQDERRSRIRSQQHSDRLGAYQRYAGALHATERAVIRAGHAMRALESAKALGSPPKIAASAKRLGEAMDALTTAKSELVRLCGEAMVVAPGGFDGELLRGLTSIDRRQTAALSGDSDTEPGSAWMEEFIRLTRMLRQDIDYDVQVIRGRAPTWRERQARRFKRAGERLRRAWRRVRPNSTATSHSGSSA